MFNIRPKNYKEVVCLKQCQMLQRNVPDLTDEQMEEIFRFVMVDGNMVVGNPGNITLRSGDGTVVRSFTVAAPVGRTYDSIMLTAAVCRITYPYVASGDSDGGVSGNNNNNNNNNNNG